MMPRIVQPELLDELPPTEKRAMSSRADLRRLNVLLGHAGIVSGELGRQRDKFSSAAKSYTLAELGAGDGTFLLRVARRSEGWGRTVAATLIDRQNLVSAKTRLAFAAVHWQVESAKADIFDWLEQTAQAREMMMANLFLHHFSDPSLSALLRLAAARTKLFIACEPRRSPFALAFSRWIGCIGCNSVTRHDAVLSVRAGFLGRELSALWPSDEEWQLSERRAGLFSHCFVARKRHG